MSFSSNRRLLQDESLAVEHRASHARSCALHVANKLGVERETVIDYVKQRSGVSLHAPQDGGAILSAFKVLEALRQGEESINAK